jgi:glucose uptake protein GlcU
LGIFGVTAVHNVVHLLVGFAFLAGAQNDRVARLVSMTIGAVYTLVGVIGVLNLALVNDLLNINLADNLLHFATGLLALAVAFQGRRAAVTA